jgi:hypothetical protein
MTKHQLLLALRTALHQIIEYSGNESVVHWGPDKSIIDCYDLYSMLARVDAELDVWTAPQI